MVDNLGKSPEKKLAGKMLMKLTPRVSKVLKSATIVWKKLPKLIKHCLLANREQEICLSFKTKKLTFVNNTISKLVQTKTCNIYFMMSLCKKIWKGTEAFLLVPIKICHVTQKKQKRSDKKWQVTSRWRCQDREGIVCLIFLCKHRHTWVWPPSSQHLPLK